MRPSIFKTAATIAIATTLASACASTQSLPDRTSLEEKTSMLTILTSADPETQLMALAITSSARTAGQTPRILLCSKGGDLALQSPPPAALAPLKPQGVSPQGVLKQLIGSGVRVDVCAIYLPNREVGKESLIEGVGVTRPDEIAVVLSTPGEIVLSF